MTVKRPENYKETRIVNKRKASATDLPSLSLTANTDSLYSGLYKGEIAINDYTPNNIIVSSVGLYVRVGGSENELQTDKLVRLGPAYVTQDLAVSNIEVGTVTADLAAGATNLVLSGALVEQLLPNQKIYTLNTAGAVSAQATIARFTITVLGLEGVSGNWAAGQRVLLSNVDTVQTYTAGTTSGIATITTSSSNRRLKVGSSIFSISNGSATIGSVTSQGTQRIYSLTNVTGTWGVGSPILMDSIGTIISYSGANLAVDFSVAHDRVYKGLELYATTTAVPAVLGVGKVGAISAEIFVINQVSGSFRKDDKVYIKPRPTIANINSTDLIRTGEIWLRSTDGAVFINNGSDWQRVTAVQATEQLEGLIELATQAEVDSGIDNKRAITPLTLNQWMVNKKLIKEKDTFFSIYVDTYTGSDLIENNGADQYRPFKTIERALLEVAKRSYVEGTANDYYANTTVYVSPGEYTIDNRPGAAAVTDIVETGITGIIHPLEVGVITTAYDATTRKVGLTLNLLDEVEENKQIFSVNTSNVVVGSCVLESLSTTDSKYSVRQLQGSWIAGLKVVVPQHRLYNAAEGGVIVPRGCSVIGVDEKKTRIKPKYVGDVALWQLDNICQTPGRSSILKVTGGCLVEGITFIDNEGIKQTGINSDLVESHHLCSSIEFASGIEIPIYYSKIVQGLRKTSTPAMIGGQLEEVEGENTIVASVDSAAVVNRVTSTPPAIVNCSVLSRYGLNGVLVDGAKTKGFKSMEASRFTSVSLQTDIRALEDAAISNSYKDKWRHYAFKVINEGYIKADSCLVVGNAVHYIVESGGEISITNSTSRFGDIGMISTGYSSVTLPQDSGAIVTHIVPPRTNPANDYQKLYWLKVTGMGTINKRRPTESYIIKFASSSGKSLPNILFTALTIDKDLSGTQLAAGTYYIALLSGDGDDNEKVENIYPGTGTVQSGLTYSSMLKFLTAYGLTQAEAITLIAASNSEQVLNPTIACEFVRPSIIRAVGQAWEWVGYGNYSDGIPKFQTRVLTYDEALKKQKKESKGGRVFCSGMDQDGNFFIGNKVFDLKNSTEN
jgi:hypothetical protein